MATFIPENVIVFTSTVDSKRGNDKVLRRINKEIKIKRRETVYLCWVTRNFISYTLKIKGKLQGREAKGEITYHIFEIFNVGQD